MLHMLARTHRAAGTKIQCESGGRREGGRRGPPGWRAGRGRRVCLRDSVCRRNARLVLHECSVRGPRSPFLEIPDKIHAGAASRGSRRPGGTASSQRRAPRHGCPGGAGNRRPGASLPAPGGAARPTHAPSARGLAADRAGGAENWAFFRANFRHVNRPHSLLRQSRGADGSRAGPQRTAPARRA